MEDKTKAECLGKWILLIKWVAECLCTNPEVITEAKTGAEVYSKLFEIWAEDCQKALKEIKDPVRKQIGYNSLVGQAFTYATLPPLLVETFRGLYGITRDQLSAIREVLPTWSEDNTILPVYENGKFLKST